MGLFWIIVTATGISIRKLSRWVAQEEMLCCGHHPIAHPTPYGSHEFLNHRHCHLHQKVVTVSSTGGDAVRASVRWILSTATAYTYFCELNTYLPLFSFSLVNCCRLYIFLWIPTCLFLSPLQSILYSQVDLVNCCRLYIFLWIPTWILTWILTCILISQMDLVNCCHLYICLWILTCLFLLYNLTI